MQGTFIGSKPIRVCAASKKEDKTKENTTVELYSATAFTYPTLYPYYPGYYEGYDPSMLYGYNTPMTTASFFPIHRSTDPQRTFDVVQENSNYVMLKFMMLNDEEEYGSLSKFGL
eukprot:TRINITY_DN7215_c0_g1_i11.p1 TRINITY_DN7215_c0_g1~~TRINITY_DN7215_c0_g1_i11.p1  ORF type:complete len:115 (-),score=19.38 TRINITY_DN7215_c0_g1_i11:191-535(-)